MGTTALAMTAMAFMATTSWAGCLDMQTGMTASVTDEGAATTIILASADVETDGAMILVSKALGGEIDGSLFEHDSSTFLADADMNSVFQPGVPNLILATETSQQLPVGIGGQQWIEANLSGIIEAPQQTRDLVIYADAAGLIDETATSAPVWIEAALTNMTTYDALNADVVAMTDLPVLSADQSQMDIMAVVLNSGIYDATLTAASGSTA